MAISKILVEYGVSVNALDEDGTSPMLEMLQRVSRLSTEIVDNEKLWKKLTNFAKLLIEAGADVSYQQELRKTELIVAVSLQNADLVKILLEAGADVNEVGRDHNRALHHCLEGLSK